MSTDHEPAAIKVVPHPAFFGLIWVGFPLIGLAAGWLLSLMLDGLLELAWMPFQGPLQTVSDLAGSWTPLVLAGVGLLVGLVVALIAHAEVEFVTVDPAGVTLTLDGKDRRINREAVDLVFVEGKTLVLQDSSGRQPARVTIADLPQDELKRALTHHGYAWTDADPHAHAFSRWVRDAPTLPPGADAILVARQTALDGGKTADAEEFRRELTRLGVVVRDDKKKQYWRLAL